jgi:hypothetical protein
VNEHSARPDEAALLRALALRLLPPYYAGDSATEVVGLLVGRLPNNLPIDLPLPAGAQVVASATASPLQALIFLDAALPPEGALDFYRERLQSTGWYELLLHRPGGFMSTGSPAVGTFCANERGPSLQIHAQSVRDRPTDIRVHLNADPQQSPCAQRSHAHVGGGRPGTSGIIPQLFGPSSGVQTGGGEGSGGDYTYSHGRLDTLLDLAAVMAHYTRQLERAGWQPREAGQSIAVAWSTWACRDDAGQQWKGFFVALHHGDAPPQYLLEIRADRVTGSS